VTAEGTCEDICQIQNPERF